MGEKKTLTLDSKHQYREWFRLQDDEKKENHELIKKDGKYIVSWGKPDEYTNRLKENRIKFLMAMGKSEEQATKEYKGEMFKISNRKIKEADKGEKENIIKAG